MHPRLLLAPLLTTALTLLLLILLYHSLAYPFVQHLDLALQLQIHAHATPNLTRIMLALTWLGAIRTFLPALALTIAWLLLRGRRHLATLLAASITGALLLNYSFKLLFHRPRPQLSWAFGDPSAPPEHTFSFPSGHSLFAVVLYGTLAYAALRRPTSHARRITLLLVAFALALAIGTSRIYFGLHYPTDVLAGYLAGSLWLTAVVLLHSSLSVRHPL